MPKLIFGKEDLSVHFASMHDVSRETTLNAEQYHLEQRLETCADMTPMEKHEILSGISAREAQKALDKEYPRLDFSFLRHSNIFARKWFPKYTVNRFYDKHGKIGTFRMSVWDQQFVTFSQPDPHINFMLDELAKGTEFFSATRRVERINYDRKRGSRYINMGLPRGYRYFFYFGDVPKEIGGKYGSRGLIVKQPRFKFKGIPPPDISRFCDEVNLFRSRMEELEQFKNLKDFEDRNGSSHGGFPGIASAYLITDAEYYDWSEEGGFAYQNMLLVGVVGRSGYALAFSGEGCLIE